MVKTADANGRLGVFKTLADVPARYRLENHTTRYNDREPYAEYVEATAADASERWRDELDIAARRWRKHIETHTDAPHYALCRPEHVESFFEWLLTEYPTRKGRGLAIDTVFRTYRPPIEGFYDYLVWSVGHPHTYSPVLMAYADETNEHARRLWRMKVGQTNLKTTGAKQ